MISSRTRKELGFNAATSTPQSSPLTRFAPLASRLLQQGTHVRGIVRIARQRRSFAVALCAASAAGLATTATVATMQHIYAAHVQPLAPAPGPLTAAATIAATPKPHVKHHLLATLAAVHPLRGLASWYGSVLHGHTTASGETFDEAMMTACHRTLPFGTLVKVTDEASEKSVVVRINDRGVLNADRVIDLSAAAATKLGILRSGLAHVRLEVVKAVKPAPAAETIETN